MKSHPAKLSVLVVLTLTFGVFAICVRLLARNPQTPYATPSSASSASTQRATTAEQTAAHEQARAAYLRASLQFEANAGQSDEEVKFLSRGAGYNLFLTRTELVLALNKNEGGDAKNENNKHHDAASPTSSTQSAVLRMKLAEANTEPRVAGESRLPGKINYFRGNDPTRWRTDVQAYERVRYEAIYPGVDLVYYGNQRQLQYDFHLAPDARPEQIALDFTGAERIEINSSGDLVLHTAGGEVRQHKPFTYQEINGKREEIASRFVMRDRDTIGFEVGDYDPMRTLVIDPVLSYASFFGGSDYDTAAGVAVDADGDVYIAGATSSSDLPNRNAHQSDFRGPVDQFGGGDAFVAKFDMNESGDASLVWATYFGGTGSDRADDIAADHAGNVFITGTTYSDNFPTHNGFANTVPVQNGYDAYVTRLNTHGALVYSTYIGAQAPDSGEGIAVVPQLNSGIVYVTGTITGATGFSVTSNAFQADADPNLRPDAFLMKINTNATSADPIGTHIRYSTLFAANNWEYGRDIAADANGFAYIVGETDSTNLPTRNAYQPNNAGGSGCQLNDGSPIPCQDAYVAKFNTNVSSCTPDSTRGINCQEALVYATYIGGSASSDNKPNDEARSIAVDNSGNAYIVGGTASSNFSTRNSFDSTYNGNIDAFALKINTTLSGNASLIYSTVLGGASWDSATGVAVDSSGLIYVTGWGQLGFPQRDAITNGYGGGVAFKRDVIAAKLDPNVSGDASLLWSTYLGGSVDDVGAGIAVGGNGAVYVAGTTESNDFKPFLPGAFQSSVANSFDAFVLRLGAAQSGCTLTLNPQSRSWNKFGGVASFDVTTSNNSCDRTATPNVPWLTITQNQTGAGNARVAYRVAANTGAARTGTITVTSGDSTLTFTVQQEADPCPGALTLSPTSANWNEFGGLSSFNVTSTSATCDWQATANVPWLTVTQGAGQGNGQVVYRVAANDAGTGRRTGTISVGDRTFTVTQDGSTFYTWTGGTLRDTNQNSGDYLWSNAGNWEPEGVPGAIDSATINNGDFVELDGVSRTVRKLTLASGGLANGVTAPVTVTPTVSTTWTGGTLQNLTLKVNDGARLDISGTANGTTITDKHLSDSIIENRGTSAWKGGTPVYLTSASIKNFAEFNVEAATDSIFNYYTGNTTVFRNEPGGRFTKTADASQATFTSSGGVEMENRGIIASDAGTLRFTTGLKLYQGSSLAGASRILIDAGTLEVLGASAISMNASGVFELTGAGVLQGSDTAQLTNGGGTFKWSGGTITGKVNTSANFRIAGAADKHFNTAQFTMSGESLWEAAGGAVYFTSSTVTNSGTFNAEADSSFNYYTGNVSDFTNTGTFVKRNSAGETTINNAVNFNNRGTTRAESGTLKLSDGTSSGAFITSAGTFIDFFAGTHALETGANFSGAGRTRVKGGTVSGLGSFGGKLEIASGSLDGTTTIASGATLDFTGGTISGTLNITSAATLNLSGAADKHFNSVTVHNAGATIWTGPAAPVYFSSTNFNNTGALNFTTDGAAFNYFTGNATIFNNTGTITKSGGAGTTDFSTSNGVFIENRGTISAGVGTFRLNHLLKLYDNSRFGGAARTLIDSGTLEVIGNALLETTATGSFEFGGASVLQSTETGQFTSSGEGSFVWTGGSITGRLTSNARFRISGTADKHFNEANVIFAGATLWTGGDIYGTSSAITNTGAFTITANKNFSYFTGSVSRFVNSGTVTKQGTAGTTAFNSTAFDNTGTLNVETGTLKLDAGTSTGRFNPSANAFIDFATGEHTLNTGANFTGAGRTRMNGGTVRLSGAVTTAASSAFALSNGTLTGTGSFNPAGAFEWTGGTISATLNITNGATLNIANGGFDKHLSEGTINNAGTAVWTGTTPVYFSSSAFNNNGTFISTATGTLTYYIGNVSVFTNRGALRMGSATASGRFRMGSGVDFVNAPSGAIHLDFFSNTIYDRIESASSTLTLGGTLGITLNNNYLPAANTTLAAITHLARTGNFALVHVTNPGAARGASVIYNDLNTAVRFTQTRPTFSFTATADTWVQGADAFRATNYGADQTLQIKRTFNPGAGRGRRGFITFDTSTLAGDIFSAKLRVFARLTTGGLSPTQMIVQKVADASWLESAVTWNAQPGVASPNALASITVANTEGAYYEFDLTGFLQAERAANRNVVSFRFINMQSTGNSGASYTAVNSREAASAQPQLIIEQ